MPTKECVICRVEFQSNWHLRRHMGSMHPNEDFIPIEQGPYDKECIICGESFTAKKSHAIYCGNRCGQRAFRKNNHEKAKETRQKWLKLNYDNDEYRAKRNTYEKIRIQRPEVKGKLSKRRKELYVSHNKRKAQERADRRFGKPPMINCAECGNEFQSPYRIRKGGNNTPKYCSKSCVNKRNNRKTLSTPKGAISDRIRRNINYHLTKNGISKNSKTFALVGFSPMDLVRHIESQFTDGMSWDNKREWQIDHIRPVSSFNFDSTDHPDFKKCWALNNLQPLWAKDNISKGNKWDGVVNA